MTPGDAYWVGVAVPRKPALHLRCRKYLLATILPWCPPTRRLDAAVASRRAAIETDSDSSEGRRRRPGRHQPRGKWRGLRTIMQHKIG